ncbi:hypothetical protein [Aliiroseovarius marinus]|uniref:hypothetical protein n=1 Tax=Aliiroseovarius marinus TaxID=2500159 RepID=UPI002493BE87|nr:hypothetical protein [Aliiroseovarius marinus]
MGEQLAGAIGVGAMRWFLQELLFWILTLGPWLNIYFVARLTWRGFILRAVLLIPLVVIGIWLLHDMLNLVFGYRMFSPPGAAFYLIILHLWAMGIALCVVLYVAYVRWKEKPR